MLKYYLREETADAWHNIFVYLLQAQIHRHRRLKEELKEIKGEPKAELEDQMADILPLDYNFYTDDNA